MRALSSLLFLIVANTIVATAWGSGLLAAALVGWLAPRPMSYMGWTVLAYYVVVGTCLGVGDWRRQRAP